jgi:hypothetical protein
MKQYILDWLGIGPARISRSEAIKIAREECARRGWIWIDPAEASLGMRAWTIRTNSRGLGAKAIIKVHKRTGQVLRAGYVRR